MELKYENLSPDKSIWSNVRVEQQGTIMSSVLPELEMDCYRTIGVWDMDYLFTVTPKFYGLFLTYVIKGDPFGADGAYLWLYDAGEPFVKHGFGEAWPSIKIAHPLLMCGDALYLKLQPRSTPAIQDAEKTTDGRWLFPHPKGLRASFKQLQRTTLSDDFQRLLPFSKENPRVAQTFATL